MSNKTKAISKKKAVGSSRKNSGTEIVGQLIEYVLAIVVMVLCVAVLFYAKDGYHQIGNAKFTVYRTIMLYGFSVLLVMTALYVIFWLRGHGKLRLSATDWCVAVYLVLTGVSVISGGFYEDAVWGCNGWNMGLLSQISFVLLYVFLSRFGRYYRLMLTVLCGAAAIVYGIGILHRFLIDPIGFYEGLTGSQKAQFLSTLGQASWYGSFLAVTLPVAMGVFLLAEKKLWRRLSGVCMALGFSTLVTQNSDSAYFGLAGALLVLFCVCVGEWEKIGRFAGMLALFFGVGKLMGFLMGKFGNRAMQEDFVTGLMWHSPVTWVLFAVCLCVALAAFLKTNNHWERSSQKQDPPEQVRKLARLVPVAAAVVIGCTVLLIWLQTYGFLPEAVSHKLAGISYFNWNDGWGNGRGRIWRFSVNMFSQESIKHKLFGIGPDCFHCYVSTYFSEEAALLWGEKKLTNAHNEWLNILINGGIFGAAAYLGIFLTSILSSVKKLFCRQRQKALFGALCAACVSYMCYNFFCYQQVLCTPFVFMLMGIGEYMQREQQVCGKD